MTELPEKDALEIVQRLISRTEQGTLEWEIWQQGVYEYFASSPRFRYYAKTRDDDGAAPFVLQIYRSVSPEAPDTGGAAEARPADELYSYPTTAYSEAVERLYAMARGKALGVENLKSDILDDLSDE